MAKGNTSTRKGKATVHAKAPPMKPAPKKAPTKNAPTKKKRSQKRAAVDESSDESSDKETDHRPWKKKRAKLLKDTTNHDSKEVDVDEHDRETDMLADEQEGGQDLDSQNDSEVGV